MSLVIEIREWLGNNWGLITISLFPYMQHQAFFFLWRVAVMTVNHAYFVDREKHLLHARCRFKTLNVKMESRQQKQIVFFFLRGIKTFFTQKCLKNEGSFDIVFLFCIAFFCTRKKKSLFFAITKGEQIVATQKKRKLNNLRLPLHSTTMMKVLLVRTSYYCPTSPSFPFLEKKK